MLEMLAVHVACTFNALHIAQEKMRKATLALSVWFFCVVCCVCGVDGVDVVARALRGSLHCAGSVGGYPVFMLVVRHAAAVGVWALVRQMDVDVFPKFEVVKEASVLMGFVGHFCTGVQEGA